MGLHPADIIAGYGVAAKKAHEILATLVVDTVPEKVLACVRLRGLRGEFTQAARGI